MSQEKILITGALGQIGSDLTHSLVAQFGQDNVVATDIRETPENYPFRYSKLNVMDKEGIQKVLSQEKFTQVYHLAAMLSGTAEKKPVQAWDLNMQSLLYFLEAQKEKLFHKLYWPSSIAVFGTNIPNIKTPQNVPLQPNTVYGISKVAGELWCKYYSEKFGSDIRSLRYPGLISYKAKAGGGTTDYAVEIFHAANEKQHYDCYLKADTVLPMMYIDDAILATIDLMKADRSKLTIDLSYNLQGMSFSPQDIAREIQKYMPKFTISYQPDFRQAIADSWPHSIDDHIFRKETGFQPQYDLGSMTEVMLQNTSYEVH